jgi:hypothetical protein
MVGFRRARGENYATQYLGHSTSGRGFLMDPVTVGAALLAIVSSADERLVPGCWM